MASDTNNTDVAVINEYFAMVNESAQDRIPKILCNKYAEESTAFYSNDSNKENNVGVFNVNNAVIEDVIAVNALTHVLR